MLMFLLLLRVASFVLCVILPIFFYDFFLFLTGSLVTRAFLSSSRRISCFVDGAIFLQIKYETFVSHVFNT